MLAATLIHAQHGMLRRYALTARTAEGKPDDTSALQAFFAVAVGSCIATVLDTSTTDRDELYGRADGLHAAAVLCGHARRSKDRNGRAASGIP